MFGKLKEKLKSALSVFSRKAVEQAEEKVAPAPEEKVKEVAEKKKVVEKKEVIKDVKERKPTKIEEKAAAPAGKEEKKALPRERPAPAIKEEMKKEVVPPIKEEKKKEIFEEKRPILEEIKKVERETIKEGPAEPEKKSFLSKIFQREKREKKEEKEEELPQKEKQVLEEKPSFFGKLKQAITTKTISAEKFDELFWDLELALLENNVSIKVIEKMKNDLERELVDKPLPRDVERKIEETLKRTLNEILTFETIDLSQKIKTKKPYVIAFFGINGSGKTTSIAKVAHYFQRHAKSVVFAACDTFRAAAIQQLEEHADKLGVKMIAHDYGADAAAVAYDAVKYAEKNKIDVVLIDTAGRLHSNINLMAELEKILRVAKPDFKVFVGESITGNDCIEQAKRFNELTDLDGIILTKADVDEKGGAPLSIAYTIKKPILFLGVGQRYEDLEEFDKEVILTRLGF